ncbi:MAG: Rpn family recombination-promoting nuclease/putative transposase [Cyanomargarita calcarea GSE-NOS-MK-12-04C]|jgi:predicted transposase/invertase (TIGR01784 family)|uniref:Rpn family recombination-promoting nuclease/putative transposase n=1 Tax=Cyanomargarita calcarea GSE-NOS-MK-12-04C TaxID=2839659 RepID=A0A951QTB1_9CYAN|nr:Rpn family recombination-promoting nuclease/putative transposase [Cyanomargarita calcarea GSE-NOS-MK-12-04C]
MTADPLFYKIFKDIPELFFELIGEPHYDKSIYQYSAPEIKQQGFRLDGLLSTRSGYNFKPIYFIEAQAYKDNNFYKSFFGKIILYLTQYEPTNEEWYAVVIYDKRSSEGKFPPYLKIFLPVLRRFYLDELAKTPNHSLSVGIMRLVVEKKRQKQTGELARQLINQTKSEVTNAALQEKVLEFIQTVVIDKFPNLTLEELEVMLDLESLKKSKVYQEGISEGVLKQKLETIPILIELGLTTDQIAERLKLDVETVRENVKK